MRAYLSKAGRREEAVDEMTEPRARERGSARWVAARVSALIDDDEWSRSTEARELIEWLYLVVHRRARAMGLSVDEREEIAQDAMIRIVRALGSSRRRLAQSDNPAAVLERIAGRAVAEGRHKVRMAGLGGVPPNGRNWRVRHPRRIGGDKARQIFEQLPTPIFDSFGDVDRAAARAEAWICDRIGVTLTPDAFDALVYVLDRLVAGVGRPALLRGGGSCLRRDPAMRHLGFSEHAASAFGLWLLGRHDADHHSPSVLDAAFGGDCDQSSIQRWRWVAVSVGFATCPRPVARPA